MLLPVPSVLRGSLERAVRWAAAEIEGIGGEVAEEIIAEGSAAVERAREVARGELSTG